MFFNTGFTSLEKFAFQKQEKSLKERTGSLYYAIPCSYIFYYYSDR